jgi:hypothetical protein
LVTSALLGSVCENFNCVDNVRNEVISGDFDDWNLVFFDFNGLEFVGMGLLPDLTSEISGGLIACETVGLNKDEKYSEEVHDDLELIESYDGVRHVAIGLEDL